MYTLHFSTLDGIRQQMIEYHGRLARQARTNQENVATQRDKRFYGGEAMAHENMQSFWEHMKLEPIVQDEAA